VNLYHGRNSAKRQGTTLGGTPWGEKTNSTIGKGELVERRVKGTQKWEYQRRGVKKRHEAELKQGGGKIESLHKNPHKKKKGKFR